MLHLLDLIITPDTTLQNALERMTRNHKGLLFVCDQDTHLVGVVSDGDIRRALVGQAMLVAKVSAYMNLDPVFAQSAAEGEQLLKKHNLLIVPVVNEDGMVFAAVVQGVDAVDVLLRESTQDAGMSPELTAGVVAIIPARGGSKRIPRKNIALLAGKPLLAYAIEPAQKANSVSYLVVSTDDDEIADVARQYGVGVPWLRPAHLAQDNTSSIDVVLHAAQWAREVYGDGLQYGILLEPTAPLRTASHIDQAIRLLQSTSADSVVSVCQVPHVFNPEELLTIKDGQLSPYILERTMDTRLLRNQQPPAYVQNGLIYAFRLDMLLHKKSLYGDTCLPLVVGWEYFLDIDEPSDLAIGEYKLRQLRT